MQVPRLTQLLLGILEGLLKVAACLRAAKLEDEGALGRRSGQLHFGGQEGHAEGQRLLLSQLPVHRRHQVLYHVVQILQDGEEPVTAHEENSQRITAISVIGLNYV